MSHLTLAPYLRPGHPRDIATDSTAGATYVYRGPGNIIAANIPAVGVLWADGRPVVSREAHAINGVSGISELTVTTGANTSYGGALGSATVEEVVYELDWRPVQIALEAHPAFRAGGAKALDATAREHILGWRAELDPKLKSQRKYKPLDSDGNPGAEVTITGNALDYIKLAEVGVEVFTEYMPVWRKRSTYRGASAPGTSEIGQKSAAPGGAGYPSGYEWVKSADSVKRVGRSSKWLRDEEWEGAKKVWVDRDEIFPPAA